MPPDEPEQANPWLSPAGARNEQQRRRQNRPASPPVDPQESLELMEKVRSLNDVLAEPSSFITSVLSQFQIKGYVTQRQYQAVNQWMARERVKLTFAGKSVPRPPEKEQRFGRILFDED